MYTVRYMSSTGCLLVCLFTQKWDRYCYNTYTTLSEKTTRKVFGYLRHIGTTREGKE